MHSDDFPTDTAVHPAAPTAIPAPVPPPTDTTAPTATPTAVSTTISPPVTNTDTNAVTDISDNDTVSSAHSAQRPSRQHPSHEISPANIVSGKRTRQTTIRLIQHLRVLATLLPPRRYADILGRLDAAAWLKAYLAEVNKLAQKGEMEVVERPPTARVIQLRELMSVKYDNILQTTEPKVRMVARGDMEEAPDHVYAPVANMVALRTFVMLSLDFDHPFRQLDVNSAFLYGRVSDPIFVELPAGHAQKDGHRLVWKTNCAISGLAQSPQIW